MEQPTHASRLRYLAASDVDDTVVDYDGLEVRGADDQRIGEVDGFIVDGQACRLHYVVVDAGGWFSSTRVLIPVGHANLSRDRRALRLDVTREALSRYPAFNGDRFRELSDDELNQFETQVDDACGPADPATTSNATQPHYTPPESSTRSPDACQQLRPVDTSSFASMRPIPVRDTYSGEHVRAHAHSEGDARPRREGPERAGDVIGTARGGDRTRVHDVPRDQNRPRRVAERAPGEEDDTRRSER